MGLPLSKSRQMGEDVTKELSTVIEEVLPAKEVLTPKSTRNNKRILPITSSEKLEELPKTFTVIADSPISPKVSKFRSLSTERAKMKSVQLGLHQQPEQASSYSEEPQEYSSIINPQKVDKCDMNKVKLQSQVQGSSVTSNTLDKLSTAEIRSKMPSVLVEKHDKKIKATMTGSSMGVSAPAETSADLILESDKAEKSKVYSEISSARTRATILAKSSGWASKTENLAPIEKTEFVSELPVYSKSTSLTANTASKKSQVIGKNIQREFSSSFKTNKLEPTEQAVQLTIKSNQARAPLHTHLGGYQPCQEFLTEQQYLEPIPGLAKTSKISKEVSQTAVRKTKPLGVSIPCCKFSKKITNCLLILHVFSDFCTRGNSSRYIPGNYSIEECTTNYISST